MSHHVEIYGITANASDDNYIFGAREDADNNFGLDLYGGNSLYWFFRTIPLLTYRTRAPYCFIVDKGLCQETYSGVTQDRSQWAVDADFHYTYSLFALNYTGTNWAFAAPGLKLSRAYFAANDGTPLRDFVSVVRLSDSEPGMYDKVNGIFYPSNGEAFTPGEPTGRYY